MKKLYIYILSFLIATSSLANKPIKNSDFITVLSIVGMPSTVCANESFTVSFTSFGFTPSAGNTYEFQLSDASGSFLAPIVAGSESSTATSGTIDITIPFNTVFGAGYQARIVATNTNIGAVTGELLSPITINCITRDYYWIGGSGNWSDLEHWEYTIDDINFTDATEVPQLTDNVNFDEFSFPTGGTLTVDQDVFCNDMYWAPEVNTGPQLLAPSGVNINVYGDLVMADGVYRDVNRFMFRSPTNHAIIDLADNTMKLNSNVYWGDGYLDFYGTSSWELESNVVANGVRMYDNTILTSNDYSLDLDYTLYLGAGTFNAGNSNISLHRIEEYGTFNAESSTLIFNKGTGIISGDAVIHNAIFESGDFNIEGTNTFNSLRLEEDVKVKLQEGATQTITSNFEALGSRSKMVEIQSSVLGNIATLELGTSTALVNFVILQDNLVNASSTPVNAFNSINNGNNTNWNIAGIASLTYYWIGGSGNWSDVEHWATTDGGTILRTDPPGPVDDVNFTTNSFPAGGKITLDISADCNNMIWTDGTTNPTISSIENNPLTIRGNFQLAAGVTRNLSDLRFESISNNVITFAESTINTVGDITFDGSGTWSLQDNLSTNTLFMNGGTLNTNNNSLNLRWRIFINGGSMFLGSSDVFLRSMEGTNPSGLFTNTSTIYVDGGGGNSEGYIYYADFVYFNLVIRNKINFWANITAENIILEAGAVALLLDGNTQIFNQSFTVEGTRNNMVTIKSSSAGNQGFITTANSGATIDVKYAQIQDIDIDNADPGLVIPINSVDNGGNIGWDFTADPLIPTDYYWVGGTGNWSDASNHWSSTDGGFANLSDPPGTLDDIIFTSNSFSASNETVTLDIPAVIHNMTWQDGSLNPTIDDGSNFNNLTLSGSLLMVNGVQRSIRTIDFNSTATNNLIQLADNQGDMGDINFYGGGTWTMLDSMSAVSLYVESGLLKTNSKNLYVQGYLYSFDQIDLGNSKINVWQFYGFAPAALGGETIYLEETGTLRTLSGFLNNVVLEGDATIRESNYINRLSATVPGSKIIFEEGKTNTINSNLELKGSQDNPLEIVAGWQNPETFAFEEHTGTQANISMSGTATVTADYVSIKDNNGTGGATFATTNSALFSNVTGWTGFLGQTITMTTVDVPFSDGAVTLNATTDSGLPLSYSVSQGDGSITGNILTPNSPGLVGVEVVQAGNTTYAPSKLTNYIHFNATDLSNELGNFKEATYVVGQKDFVSNETFFDVNKTPLARKAFVTKDGKLISSGSRRVLIWNQVPGAADIPADVVLGQPDFTTTNFSVNSSTIYGSAYAIAVSDDGRLLVGDSRGILIWNSIPTVSGTPADVIIGQDDFNSIEHNAAPNSFQSAEFFILTPDQKIIISDLQGNRVLIFNQIPTSNGASADIVIGQTSLYSVSPGLGSDKLDGPGYPSLSSDGKLFIPDARNNRILVYNSVPTVSGASADYVLGQVDMNSNVEGIGATGLDYPYSVGISRTGKMAVADRQNDRVLIYNSIPTNNTIAADYVLGQPDFNTEGINTGGLSGRSINDAYAVYWDVSDNLYVGDLQNNRFLVWGLPDFTAPIAFTTGAITAAGAVVVPGYWNSTNSSVEITIPIADDATLSAGLIQLQLKIGNGNYNNIGDSVAILGANIGVTQIVSIDSATLKAATDYKQDSTIIFRALIFDAAGNQTLGAESASTLIIDTVSPADFTTGEISTTADDPSFMVANYWNTNNTGVDVLVPVSVDPSLAGGTVQINMHINGGNPIAVGPLTTITTLNTDLTISLTKTDFEAITGLLEGSVIAASAAITDVAGNPATFGDVSSNALTIDRIAPALNTDNSTIATTYVDGESTQSLLSMIADTSGIKEVVIYYHLISTNVPDEFSMIVLTKDANNNFIVDHEELVQVSSEQHGIVYYIEILDNAGNKFSGIDNKQSVNIKYPNGIDVTNFGVGSTTEAYKMMAIPLDLESKSVNDVFDEVYGGTFDKSKMRIFSYAGGTATTYNELSGSTPLNMGVGYFALAADNVDVISSPGTTSFEPFQDLNLLPVAGYSIELVSGWNMIGNPFMHAINWAEIEFLSNVTAGDLDGPQIYDGSTFPSVEDIPASSGAFIHNNTASTISIKIPARKVTSGRIAPNSPNQNSLIDDSWEVIFTTKGIEGNEFNLGGIGMEPEAIFSKDQFDLLNPPTFASMKVVSFEHHEFSAHSFKLDVRETAAEEKWEFEYRIDSNSDEKHTINWNNSYFGDNTPDLYLVDKTHFTSINMKDVSSYSFSHGSITKFEIYYGDNALKNIIPEQLITQSPFPNPFSNEVAFNIGLPQDDSYSIDIKIFDSVGKMIKSISESDITSGYNSIKWNGLNSDGRAIPNGMYAYSIHIKGSNIDVIENGKIIKR